MVKALRKFGYAQGEQTGSHIRMTTQTGGEHHVTVPNHRPIKVGTLHDILKDVATRHGLTVEQLMREMDL